MAFTENETEEILRQLEEEFWAHRRPPINLRDKIREGQRIEDHSIELFFVRPAFRRPDEWIEEPITKIRYIRSRNVWGIYWQRADLKWHRYDPNPETNTLPAALAIIGKDTHGCFFG